LIGKTISIYNGQTFVKIQIKKEMLGLKLGELSISKVLGFMQKKTKKHQPKSKS
jgi:ribosomal protein S19